MRGEAVEDGRSIIALYHTIYYGGVLLLYWIVCMEVRLLLFLGIFIIGLLCITCHPFKILLSTSSSWFRFRYRNIDTGIQEVLDKAEYKSHAY